MFERVLLSHLVSQTDDGRHQHGYKAGHGTNTAMLTIQGYLAEFLDKKKHVMMYSLDLSAAFDMLRVDIFIEMFNGKIDSWLLHALVDFLTERKCQIDVGGDPI